MANDLEKLKRDFHALVSEFPFTTAADFVLVLGWLNDGQRDAARKTKCLTKYDVSTLSSTASLMNYDLGLFADFLEVNKNGGVTYDGRRIDPATIDELDSANINWRNFDAGATTLYAIESMTGLRLILPPLETGKAIGVHYYYMAPDMVGDATKPFDSKTHLYPYHDVPLLYAVGLAKFAKGMFATRELALGEYTARLEAMRVELKPEEDERPSFKIDPFLAKIRKARAGIT